jgi:hypothetical protein
LLPEAGSLFLDDKREKKQNKKAPEKQQLYPGHESCLAPNSVSERLKSSANYFAQA